MNASLSSETELAGVTSPEQWVDAHGGYLFNFAVGQLRDQSVAEDVVQETFLAAFKTRDRFAGQCSERTWLVSILRHKIYDNLRKHCREKKHRVEPTAADSVAQSARLCGAAHAPAVSEMRRRAWAPKSMSLNRSG